MFTMLSGIRLHSANRPYLGSISSNLNPHGLPRSPGGFGVSGGGGWGSGTRQSQSRVRALTGGGFSDSGRVHLLEIELDKDAQKPTFEPGQEVSGRLIIVCGSNLRFRSLSVTMRGYARVHWTESRFIRRVFSEEVNEEVEYFNKKRFLMSPSANGDRHVLHEGRHEFEFRFQLPPAASSSVNDPPQLATSFEGRYGSVRYFVRADLEKSWSCTHKARRPFTVILPRDVDTDEEHVPVIQTCSKTICCWLCTAGEVDIAAATDRKGYYPGESIAIDALFQNNSSRNVIPKAVLCQTQTFSARGKTRTRRSKFTAVSGLEVAAGREGSWEAIPLQIPPVCPSIDNCGLIKVEYAVQVSLSIPGSCGLSIYLPVVVGNVRHRTHEAGLMPFPSPCFSDEEVPSYREAALAAAASACEAAAAAVADPPPPYLACVDGDRAEGEVESLPLYRSVFNHHCQPTSAAETELVAAEVSSTPPAYAEIDPLQFQGSSASSPFSSSPSPPPPRPPPPPPPR